MKPYDLLSRNSETDQLAEFLVEIPVIQARYDLIAAQLLLQELAQPATQYAVRFLTPLDLFAVPHLTSLELSRHYSRVTNKP